MRRFPHLLITALFCVFQIVLYIAAFFPDVKQKLVGVAVPVIAVMLLSIFTPPVNLTVNETLPGEPSFSENAVVTVADDSVADVLLVSPETGDVSIRAYQYGGTEFVVADNATSLRFYVKVYDDNGVDRITVTRLEEHGTDAEADVREDDPVQAEETTEAESAETLFRQNAEATLCIFTSTGSNGTGFLYNDWFVVTNAHVLYEAEDFTLTDIKGQEYKGTVIFTDNESDIAIIQAEGYTGKNAVLGDSDAVAPGQPLLFIGNPAGGAPFSYCTGKRVEAEESVLNLGYLRSRYIPVDAPIVSGYSGGPVFTREGEVIGISNAANMGDFSDYGIDHLGFIIPINSVKELIETNCTA